MNRDIEIEKNQLLLTGEYLEVYQKLEEKIIVSEFFHVNKSGCLEDIIRLLLAAQEQEQKVDEVIGADIDVFCAEIMKNHRKDSINLVVFFRIGFALALALLIGFGFYIINIFSKHNVFFTGKNYSIGMFVSYGTGIVISLIDFIVEIVLKKKKVYLGKAKHILIRVLYSLLLAAIMIVIGLLMDTKLKTTMLNLFVFTVGLLVVNFLVYVVDKQGGFVGLFTFHKASKVYGEEKLAIKQTYLNQYIFEKKKKPELTKEGFIEEAIKNLQSIYVLSFFILALMFIEDVFVVVLLFILPYEGLLAITAIVVFMFMWIVLNVILSYRIHKRIIEEL